MKPTSLQQQPTRQDSVLVRKALLRLTAAQKILCAVVIVVVALVWYDLLKRVVAFGRDIDYGGLTALGVQTVAFLKQYNPFFWWAVVALCTLIIVYLLHGFVKSTQRHVRGKLVDEETVGELFTKLSPPAQEVLQWSWQDRKEPITVGDLQRTAFELRSGRYSKIVLARRHAALLQSTTQSTLIPADRLQTE